jgi:hypothetical protein
MFGKKQEGSRIVPPYASQQKAKLTVDVDLMTQQCFVSCDKTLPGIMLANILIQAAAGCLMEVQRQEAMLVGRQKAMIGGSNEPPSGKDLINAVDSADKEVSN